MTSIATCARALNNFYSARERIMYSSFFMIDVIFFSRNGSSVYVKFVSTPIIDAKKNAIWVPKALVDKRPK